MSGSAFHVRFDRLDAEKEQALAAFFADPRLLVRGADARPWPAYRGGCLPLLVVGAVLATAPVLLRWEVPPIAVLLVATGWLGWGTAQWIRTARAHRKSRRLAAGDGGWHGIAWDGGRFALRCFEDNLLVPWEHVVEVRFLDARWGGTLADTLWLHLQDGRKVLVPSQEGRFCGRTSEAWFEDVAEALRVATGRVGTRPGPVTR